MNLYEKTAIQTARLITRNYSTSFYMSVKLLEKDVREAIFSVYGFVRLADEIVDTFHEYNKMYLLDKFESDLKDALEHKISLNPALHAFQKTVELYQIPYELIDAFLRSMRMDLDKQVYENKEETGDYIYGSANVVGLMCLKIFTNNDRQMYEQLKQPAMMLGSAFQKVNFLRDLNADIEGLDRVYFCECKESGLDEASKQRIVNEIRDEFHEAYKGIKLLPGRSRLAVLTAYNYYLQLLRKIESTPASEVMHTRVRVSDSHKMLLLCKAMFYYKLKLI